MKDLVAQLKDLAMVMTQEEYLEFVYQPLMQANGEKLRAGIEKTERERPELVKAIKDNGERILAQFQKDWDESAERLKEENEQQNKKIPTGEHCNGCVFLKFERQPWLDADGDCCQHGELTCVRHKCKIEVDKVVSNGCPFFQMPLYKKCDDCIDNNRF